MHFRRTVILVCTVLASLSFSTSWAVEDFPQSNTMAARQRINAFVDAGTDQTGRIVNLRNLEIEGLPAIHLLLDVSFERLSDKSISNGSRRRVGTLLDFAGDIARNVSIDQNSNLMAAIREQMEKLLDRCQFHGRNHDSVIYIYDSLAFWTPKDFWFFMQHARNTGFLIDHNNRIQNLIPHLSDQQLDAFAGALRSIRPYNLVQLSLLLDSGRMAERELTIFFKLGAERLANKPSEYEDSLTIARGKILRDEAVAPTLKRLFVSVKLQNPAALTAFNKAKRYADSQPPSLQSDLRRSFFTNVLNNKFDWPDFSAWTPQVLTLPPDTSPKYEVNDNVILVDFKYRSCDDLMK